MLLPTVDVTVSLAETHEGCILWHVTSGQSWSVLESFNEVAAMLGCGVEQEQDPRGGDWRTFVEHQPKAGQVVEGREVWVNPLGPYSFQYDSHCVDGIPLEESAEWRPVLEES